MYTAGAFFVPFRRQLVVAAYTGFSSPFAIATVHVEACHVSVVVRASPIEAFPSSFKGKRVNFEARVGKECARRWGRPAGHRAVFLYAEGD